mgnify:CR=1 FL=1
MRDILDELASEIEAAINEVGEMEVIAMVLRVSNQLRKDRVRKMIRLLNELGAEVIDEFSRDEGKAA